MQKGKHTTSIRFPSGTVWAEVIGDSFLCWSWRWRKRELKVSNENGEWNECFAPRVEWFHYQSCSGPENSIFFKKFDNRVYHGQLHGDLLSVEHLLLLPFRCDDKIFFDEGKMFAAGSFSCCVLDLERKVPIWQMTDHNGAIEDCVGRYPYLYKYGFRRMNCYDLRVQEKNPIWKRSLLNDYKTFNIFEGYLYFGTDKAVLGLEIGKAEILFGWDTNETGKLRIWNKRIVRFHEEHNSVHVY